MSRFLMLCVSAWVWEMRGGVEIWDEGEGE